MLELGKWIMGGEIRTLPRGVEGGFYLKGCSDPVQFHLTGPVDPALADLNFVFEASARPQTGDPRPILAPQQVGPLGALGLTVDEDANGANTGTNQGRIFLEWYGRDGHLVIDLPEALLDFSDFEDRPTVKRPDALQGTIGSHSCRFHDAFQQRVEAHRPNLQELEPGKTPSALQEIAARHELFESNQAAVSVAKRFDPPLRPPEAQALNDSELEFELAVVLAQLAQLQIQVEVCDHLDWRQVYGVLLEQTVPSEFPCDFKPFHTVEHFGTWDFCSECSEDTI